MVKMIIGGSLLPPMEQEITIVCGDCDTKDSVAFGWVKAELFFHSQGWRYCHWDDNEGILCPKCIEEMGKTNE
jgi:hypothetical protein